MEFSNPSENLGSTSTPEASASPAPAEASTPSTEASQAEPANQASPTPVEASPASSSEFPEDVEFQALAPEQRRNNWKQLRERYAETKKQVEAYDALKPRLDKVEERGGWDRLDEQAAWAEKLFSPVVDPDTNELVYDQNGLPQ